MCCYSAHSALKSNSLNSFDEARAKAKDGYSVERVVKQKNKVCQVGLPGGLQLSSNFNDFNTNEDVWGQSAQLSSSSYSSEVVLLRELSKN
jgi:hypothetical protein